MCLETNESLTHYREEIPETLLGDRHDQPIEEMTWNGFVTEIDGGLTAHAGPHVFELLSRPRTSANKELW